MYLVSRYFFSVTFNSLLPFRKSTYMLSRKLCISNFGDCILVVLFFAFILLRHSMDFLLSFEDYTPGLGVQIFVIGTFPEI